ncbi:rod shape-determining protein MreC [Candidatus Falkowbacteria bacterium]|nr:rod shape-determining protein MreC [Candidatus Falkowbacteria bacterium]
MLFLGRTIKITIWTVVIIFLLFFLHYLRVTIFFENIIIVLTNPILRTMNSASVAISESYFNWQNRQELAAENKILKDQLSTVISEQARCKLVEEENEFLQKQLKYNKSKKYEIEIAAVIGKSGDSALNALILDKGEKEGIEIGQPVIVGEGILIGKIFKVNKKNSIALLLNDDLSKIAVTVLNSIKTIGLVEGEYGLGMKMRLIPAAEVIKEDDLIITSGLEKKLPRGLTVGLVKNVKKAPEELFQEITIDSTISFEKQSLVTVIKTHEDNN